MCGCESHPSLCVFSHRSETINPLQPRFVCVVLHSHCYADSFLRSSFVTINFSYWLFSRSSWFSDINRNSFTTVPDLKTHKTHVYSLHQPELQVFIDFDGKKHFNLKWVNRQFLISSFQLL